MSQQATDTIGALDRAFLALPAAVAVPAIDRERALSWAHAATASQPDAAEKAIALVFAVEMLLSLPPAIAGSVGELRAVVDSITELTGTSRVVLARFVFAGELPSASGHRPSAGEPGLMRTLALSVAILGATSASIWQDGPGAPVEACVTGDRRGDQRESFATALELLAADGPAELAVGDACGVRLATDPGGIAGGLVCTGLGGPRAELSALLTTVGGALAQGLETLEAGTEPARVSAAQRQLTQLRFDLHDGPMQDLALLGQDLALFSGQLEAVLSEHPLRERIVGRVEDLKAMLVALEGDLRRIASLLESPFLQSRSFPEALAQITGAFAQRTETVPVVELQGELGDLPDPYYITLLALIREALNNIREHSDAAHVSIGVNCSPDAITATVSDDGRGFDPEEALIEAARGGHLGLVGMHERVQMLGGSTQIESRPGGPTVISVSLPRGT